MKHFANLAPHELEMLALLSEECAEVIFHVQKAIRHGLTTGHPDSNLLNREQIAREAGQLLSVIEMCKQLGLLYRRDDKWHQVGEYLHHVEVTDPVLRTVRIREGR